MNIRINDNMDFLTKKYICIFFFKSVSDVLVKDGARKRR